MIIERTSRPGSPVPGRRRATEESRPVIVRRAGGRAFPGGSDRGLPHYIRQYVRRLDQTKINTRTDPASDVSSRRVERGDRRRIEPARIPRSCATFVAPSVTPSSALSS